MAEQSNPSRDIVVANDGARNFSDLSRIEQKAVKGFYMQHQYLALRAVSRLCQIKYGSLYYTATDEGWKEEREKLAQAHADLGTAIYNYRAASREAAVAGVYQIFDNLLKVHLERAHFSAQEGYLDAFDFESFEKIIQAMKSLEGVFSKPDIYSSATEKNAKNTILNALQINMDSGDKMKLAGVVQSLVDELVVPVWPDANVEPGVNGEPVDVEMRELPSIDPAQGETR